MDSVHELSTSTVAGDQAEIGHEQPVEVVRLRMFSLRLNSRCVADATERGRPPYGILRNRHVSCKSEAAFFEVVSNALGNGENDPARRDGNCFAGFRIASRTLRFFA
jgi:hypothetical protein